MWVPPRPFGLGCGWPSKGCSLPLASGGCGGSEAERSVRVEPAGPREWLDGLLGEEGGSRAPGVAGAGHVSIASSAPGAGLRSPSPTQRAPSAVSRRTWADSGWTCLDPGTGGWPRSPRVAQEAVGWEVGSATGLAAGGPAASVGEVRRRLKVDWKNKGATSARRRAQAALTAGALTRMARPCPRAAARPGGLVPRKAQPRSGAWLSPPTLAYALSGRR
jgi:hypothetical protein